MQYIDYHPIGGEVVEMAVATAYTSGAVTTVRIYLRSVTTIATPLTYITDNALEHEVISRAGLDEDAELASYSLVTSEALGDYNYYVLDATLS